MVSGIAGDAEVDWQLVRPGEDYPRLVWQIPIEGDLAGLWGVDGADMMVLVEGWLTTDGRPGDLDANGQIDLADYARLCENWLRQ